MKLAIIGVCSLLVMNTLAYSSGPPDSACGTLQPDVTQHGASRQTRPTPYNITLGSDQYAASGIILVTLSGTATDDIKGFLIYARKADGSAPTTPVGSFSGVDAATTAKVQDKCGTGSETGMSHSQPIDQETVSLQWDSPSTLQGNIEFIYTIVKQRDTYWVGATSAVVWDGQGTRPATTLVPPTITPAMALSNAITVAGCADTKSCYQSSGCTDENCDFLVTFAKQPGNKVDFELRVPNIGVSRYAAVGIAAGNTMDDVTVIACQADGTGKSEVKHYFAKSKATGVTAITGTAVTDGGTSEASISGGMMSCRFTYDNDMAKANLAQYKDLSSGEYYLSLAYGSVANGQIGKHEVTPSPSIATSLFRTQHVILGGSVNVLIKAHACVMVFAWLFCASLGMILARYYKPMWVSSKACGQKVWFSYHRALMLTTMFSTLIGLILILIHNKGAYSQIDSLPYKAHPIIGLIAIICCLLNPLLAAFRCHPDDKKRPFFNWFHWFFGTVAHVFAIVAIFLGMLFSSAHVPGWIVYVMMGWCLFHVLCEFILEIHQCCLYDKNRDRQEQFQMVSKGEQNTPEPKYAGRRFKCGMLIIYGTVTTIFAIALIVIIAIWKNT